MKPGSWWQRYRVWRRRNVVEIVTSNVGFNVAGTSVRWGEILTVTAFKRDLLTVDLICLLIETPTTLVEINEEMIGYTSFEAQLVEALGLSLDWKLTVMFPAFATNATPVFERRPKA